VPIPAVAIINETAVRVFFAGEDPLGKRFGYTAAQKDGPEIIGVVKDSKYSSLRASTPPAAFRPMLQSNSGTFAVRSTVDPSLIDHSIRETARSVAPGVPFDVGSHARQVANRYTRERFFAMSYSLFGALAMLVASIGLFG
jgi:hypothetical protein